MEWCCHCGKPIDAPQSGLDCRIRDRGPAMWEEELCAAVAPHRRHPADKPQNWAGLRRASSWQTLDAWNAPLLLITSEVNYLGAQGKSFASRLVFSLR
jgi:hypothetical protein